MQPNEAIFSECQKKPFLIDGKIELFCNNAGIFMRHFPGFGFWMYSAKWWDTNFSNGIMLPRYCLPEILKTKGSIIEISSINWLPEARQHETSLFGSKYAMEWIFGRATYGPE